jgi:glycosyltransferase involved in cell wall biosynthesis
VSTPVRPFESEKPKLMSLADLPLVSVLTPSYNQAVWLPDNLRSVAGQTHGNIEHIVMDGGSTDGTVDILQAAGDTVRWRSETDRGQSDAVNKAFAESTGEIIGWLNSDDAYFDSKVVEDVVAAFVRNPQVDVVFGHSVQVTGDGHVIQVMWAPDFNSDLMRVVDPITQPSAFIRRSALTSPMLDESFHFAMDYELWLRLEAAGHRFHRLDRITSVDRHHSGRKSLTIKDVYESDLQRLSAMYDLHLTHDYDRERRKYYIGQRLMGAMLIPGIRGSNLAWNAPADFKHGLWRRQLFQRRSVWPEEYR